MGRKIIRRRGDIFPHVIKIVDKCSGDPVDVTGNTFRLVVDPSDEPTNSTNNIWDASGVITDASGGVVEFTPDAGEADNVGDYYYDIEMGPDTRTIENGSFVLKQDIAK